MGKLPVKVTLVIASALCIIGYNQIDARDSGVNAQIGWDKPNNQVADMLTGSLEYSWLAPTNQPASQGRKSPVAIARIEDLQPAFDSSVTSSSLVSPSDLENVGKEAHNCMAYFDTAMDTSVQLLDAINKAIDNNEDIAQVLSPLSKTIIMPTEDDSQSTVANAMRSLEMGLIGFHYVMQSFSQEVIEAYFADIVSQSQLLRQQARDIVNCEDNAAYFELASPNSRPSCQSVQIFYDDYYSQAATKIEAQIAKDDTDKDILKTLLASLQFQSAGAYLTYQGAQDVAKQLEKSGTSEEVSSLLQSVDVVIGAGDALQACQSSVRKSAIQQETSSISVSDFEQMIYSHLGMGMKSMDPTMRTDLVEANTIADDDVYGSCQKLLDETITVAKTVEENTKSLKGEGLSRIASTVLSRYVDMVEERLQNSLDRRPEMELRQLDFALGVLVKTIKVLPPWRSYGAMKGSLSLIQQLEAGVHKLYGCVLSKTPPRNPEDSASDENSKGPADPALSNSKTIQCDILAESYRDSLTVFLKQVSSVKKKSIEEDKEVVQVLKTNIEDLAENIEDMEEAHDLGVEVQDRHSRQAVFRAIYTQSQIALSKSIRELSEFVPFMIVQANSLEACSNIRRVTDNRRIGEGEGDLDEDEDIDIENVVEEELLNSSG